MNNLELRLRAAEKFRSDSSSNGIKPTLIISYVPALLVDPHLHGVQYSMFNDSVAKHITVDVNLVLDYAKNKKQHLSQPDKYIAMAMFENVPVNTPYPNKHWLVGYSTAGSRRFNELLWPNTVDLATILRTTGYDRKNGSRATDLETLTPFLTVTVHERWHIDGITFGINKQFPVTLLLPGYSQNGTTAQATYHKVDRHWELTSKFTRDVLVDDAHVLTETYQVIDDALPVTLPIQGDSALIRNPLKQDLTQHAKWYDLSCGLDFEMFQNYGRFDNGVYFPTHHCLYYDTEFLVENNQYSHIALQPIIVPQPYAYAVKRKYRKI